MTDAEWARVLPLLPIGLDGLADTVLEPGEESRPSPPPFSAVPAACVGAAQPSRGRSGSEGFGESGIAGDDRVEADDFHDPPDRLGQGRHPEQAVDPRRIGQYGLEIVTALTRHVMTKATPAGKRDIATVALNEV
ncbi:MULTISPECIES: hypothetical protein [unclassified Streptomyces]|uniref:hypothetical protein n=1 Tax=unclassified Streptomyces TaxID=2593676 RepID=UPI00339F7A74